MLRYARATACSDGRKAIDEAKLLYDNKTKTITLRYNVTVQKTLPIWENDYGFKYGVDHNFELKDPSINEVITEVGRGYY